MNEKKTEVGSHSHQALTGRHAVSGCCVVTSTLSRNYSGYGDDAVGPAQNSGCPRISGRTNTNANHRTNKRDGRRLVIREATHTQQMFSWHHGTTLHMAALSHSNASMSCGLNLLAADWIRIYIGRFTGVLLKHIYNVKQTFIATECVVT